MTPDQMPVDSERQYRIANEHFSNEEYREVVEILEGVVAAEPEFPDAYSKLGMAYVMLDQPDLAINPFKKALELGAPREETLSWLGLACLEVGRFQEAAEAYDAVARINPDSVDALSGLGETYSAMGQHEEALECYMRRAGMSPNSSPAYCDLASALADLDRFEESEEAWKQAIIIDSENIRARRGLCLLYYRTGRQGKCLDQYEAMKRLDPEAARELCDALGKSFKTMTEALCSEPEPACSEGSSENRIRPEDWKQPFALTVWGILLMNLVFFATLGLSIKHFGVVYGLILSFGALVGMSVWAFRAMWRSERKAEEAGMEVDTGARNLRRIRKLNRAMKEIGGVGFWGTQTAEKAKTALKIAEAVGLAILLVGGPVWIGTRFGPINGILVMLAAVFVVVRIKGYESDGRVLIEPLRFKELVSTIRASVVTLARDLMIIAGALLLATILLTPFTAIYKASADAGRTAWVTGIRIMITFVGAIATMITYHLYVGFKHESPVEMEFAIKETEDYTKEQLKRSLFSGQKGAGRLAVYVAKRPTVFPSLMTGAFLALFTQITLLGGAGNLSQLSVIGSFRYVVQILVDALTQDASSLFGLKVSHVVPADLPARLYSTVARYIVVALIVIYAVNLRVTLRRLSRQRRTTRGGTDDRRSC